MTLSKDNILTMKNSSPNSGIHVLIPLIMAFPRLGTENKLDEFIHL